MNSSNETNDASPAIAGSDSDTADTRPLPPLTFARDRRKYTRHLSTLRPGPGLQLFESPEHEAFGDGLTFVNDQGVSFTQSPPNTNYFISAGGQSFSFGQILALGGDFYGVPSQPISDASGDAAQQQRFTDAFNLLYNEPNVPLFGTNLSPAQNILAIMQDQSEAVSQAAANLLNVPAGGRVPQDAWSQAYSQTNDDHQFDKRYNLATGAQDSTPWWLSKGTYLQLAQTNWDHFGAGAVAAYRAGHACALQAAGNGDYTRAYCMEAFACHYLTDLFSSGHLRTPRKALHTANPASDLCSQLMHDEDCYNGLVVQNPAGTVSWTAYGDKRLNDTVNATNFSYARAAVQASLSEVIAALKTRNPAPVYGALKLIPDLNFVSNAADTRNWSPLYILVNGAPQVRVVPTDLKCRKWTANFYYADTYWAVPSGGVHSIGGAPPGKGTGPAHAITWQNHRIVNNQSDLAPSAALVTNFDPSLTNNQAPGQFGAPFLPGQQNPDQQNTLCVVFRKTSSDDSNHHVHFLAIPMTDAPAFKIYNPSDIAIGTSSKITANGGDPAVVALTGALLMIFASSDGTLYQASWSAATRSWSAAASNGLQLALGSADNTSYKLVAPPSSGDAAPRVGLCNITGTGLYMAFPTRAVSQGGNIMLATWSAQTNTFATPRQVAYLNAGGQEVYPRTSLGVSLVEYNNGLVLAFADVANNNQITVLRDTGKQTWTLLTANVLDATGKAVTTHSALSLVQYGGSLMLVVNDSGGNIYTYAFDTANGKWLNYQIQGTSNGSTKAGPLQTKYALSAVSYGGSAYVVFTDKANGAPSIMTTATTPAS